MHESPLTSQQKLSPGCISCQAGKWLCLFLTYRCQGGCAFCPAPHQDDRTVTEYGASLEEVLEGMESVAFTGVAFSGGDCFLAPERLLRWLNEIHRLHPHVYYWVYTNGRAATPALMEELARYGLNEIRFNLAATGYDDAAVWRNMQIAVQIFPHVAVEIPSIPDHFEKVCKVLPGLEAMGIHYLNLHEYIVQKDESNARSTPFNLLDRISYDAKSLENTEKIIHFCASNRYNLIINNCSIAQKEEQMRQRRLRWAQQVKRPHEVINAECLLETCCKRKHLDALRDGGVDTIPSSDFLPPQQQVDDRHVRVVMMPPLMKEGVRQIVRIVRIMTE